MSDTKRTEPGTATIFVANHDRMIVGKFFAVMDAETLNEFIADYNDSDRDFILMIPNPNFKI